MDRRGGITPEDAEMAREAAEAFSAKRNLDIASPVYLSSKAAHPEAAIDRWLFDAADAVHRSLNDGQGVTVGNNNELSDDEIFAAIAAADAAGDANLLTVAHDDPNADADSIVKRGMV
jgi:hypothetical protein